MHQGRACRLAPGTRLTAAELDNRAGWPALRESWEKRKASGVASASRAASSSLVAPEAARSYQSGLAAVILNFGCRLWLCPNQGPEPAAVPLLGAQVTPPSVVSMADPGAAEQHIVEVAGSLVGGCVDDSAPGSRPPATGSEQRRAVVGRRQHLASQTAVPVQQPLDLVDRGPRCLSQQVPAVPARCEPLGPEERHLVGADGRQPPETALSPRRRRRPPRRRP